MDHTLTNFLTGVLIGFDRDVYTVSESNGSVTLLVQVLSGQLSEDTVVQLTTTDDTAQGTITHTCIHCILQ